MGKWVFAAAHVYQVSESGAGPQTHDQQRRSHVTEKQRSVVRIVFVGCHLPFGSLQELQQVRAKVEIGLGCADSLQLFESPDDAGSTDIDAAVSVVHAAVKGMCRPKLIAAEVGERIADDFVNRLDSSTLIPRL
jgi:hypothetical protein